MANEASQPDVVLTLTDITGRRWTAGAWVGALEDKDGEQRTIQQMIGVPFTVDNLVISNPVNKPSELDRLRAENAELRSAALESGHQQVDKVEAAGGKVIIMHAIDGNGREWALGCHVASAVAKGGQVGDVGLVLQRAVDITSIVVVDR